jgi:hypothetical protein
VLKGVRGEVEQVVRFVVTHLGDLLLMPRGR